tara:strand:- start:1307 stop:2587 length:1281 start_codon:yes stop_codon:yes gene_type:complete
MKKIALTLFLILTINSFSVLAEKINVIWTGFSINADYKDLEKSAYYTNLLLQRYQSNQNIIDATLLSQLILNNFNNINIMIGTQQLSEATSKFALSVFLDQELFEEFKLPDDDCKKINLPECYIYSINNYYQIIFFDFSKMTFIKAIPFQNIFISDPLAKLDESQKVDLLELSYQKGKWLNGGSNIQSDEKSENSFIEILNNAKINTYYDSYVGINPNENGFNLNKEKIKDFIPDYIYENIHLLKRHVANTFLGELALKNNIVIVPYFEGVAIGNKIRGKYADREEAYEITIPEPDFFIDVEIRGFVKKKFKVDENVKGLTWYVYGAGINLKFYEPFLNKVYLDIKMTKADYKKIPDILNLNKTNEFVNIINLTYKPLAIEFSEITSKEISSNERIDWLKKITKDSTNIDDIVVFSEFLDRIKSTE